MMRVSISDRNINVYKQADAADVSHVHTASFYNLSTPSFEGRKLSTVMSYSIPLPILRLNKFNIDEYNGLTAFDKSILRFQYKCLTKPFNTDFYKNSEIIHEHVSDFLKEDFDKKYGANNYVVVSIGRSLSSITKVLGYKIGEENVKNIPMSNAPRFQRIGVVDNLSDESISKLQEYLSSIGLSIERVKNSKKQFILTDFCATGQSLNGAKILLKSDRMYGDLPNIVSQDVNWSIPDWNFRSSLRDYLFNSKFKRYSFVKKCDSLDETPSSVLNQGKAPCDVKLVWFKMLDNYMIGKKTGLSELKKEYFF